MATLTSLVATAVDPTAALVCFTPAWDTAQYYSQKEALAQAYGQAADPRRSASAYVERPSRMKPAGSLGYRFLDADCCS